jgi:hypothetical protein
MRSAVSRTTQASRAQQILDPLDIGGREAAWVLAAHAFTLLMPLVYCLAVVYYWDYLTTVVDHPFLLFVAGAVFTGGAVCESAQNAVDRWYLTEDVGSANGQGMFDLLFYFANTTGQAVLVVALAGERWWVVAVAVAAVVTLPVLYVIKGPYLAAMTVISLVAIGLEVQVFGSPVAVLQLVAAGATVYFFTALLRTRAQWLHGVTTLCAGSGFVFLIWAIADGANGRSMPWLIPIAVAAVAGALGLIAWPALNRLPASTRLDALTR